MNYTLLNGKEVSENIKEQLKVEVALLKSNKGFAPPHLGIVLVGENGASETYVKNKIKACQKIGFEATLYRFEEEISEEQLIAHIKTLNDDNAIDGFIVQSPLPPHINTRSVIETINPTKDVDGFHPINIGRMALSLPAFKPATPYGITLLLRHYNIPTVGKNCVVIGRSNIVGLPISILMGLNKEYANASVTLCHSKTKNIKEQTLKADILICAIGQPDFITADMVKEGAVVIDVGITRVFGNDLDHSYFLKGDVKFDEVAPKCSYITPVPGGVGPMTIAALLKNTMRAAKLRRLKN